MHSFNPAMISDEESRDAYEVMDIVSCKLQAAKIDRRYPATDREMDQVRVKLLEEDLWGLFAQATTEMIVTKCGRRMFPTVKIMVSGLETGSLYAFVLEFSQIGDNRWKYTTSAWSQVGKCEPRPARHQSIYIHPSSPQYGNVWMEKKVEFDKVKITNKSSDKMKQDGLILLNSLHKYVPRIHIIKLNPGNWSCKSVTLAKTEFIAVTAYQNNDVTKLKIAYNPYAKAFDQKDKKNGGNPKHEEETEDLCSESNCPNERWPTEMYHPEQFAAPYNAYPNGTPFLQATLANEITNWSPSYDYSNSPVNGHGGPIRSTFCTRSTGPYGMPYGAAKYVIDNVQITDT